jgi:hypothetical protein
LLVSYIVFLYRFFKKSCENLLVLSPKYFIFFIGGDPSAGSPTDTLLQLSPPRKDQNRPHHKEANSSELHSAGLMGGVCKTQGLIHRKLMICDYWGFQLHEGELQPSIRTEVKVSRLAPPFGLATHCLNHCVPRVAQEIRLIQTYR